MQISLFSVLCILSLVLSLTSERTNVKNEVNSRIANVNNHQIKNSLDAIAEIHNVLDDDQNGAVDSLESEDFIREDLSINDESQEDERQLSLHRGDNSISVQDMQKNWLNSIVHNWTTDDVELWLKDVVGLPQYLPIFRKFKVDGNILPRLALNTDHLIQGRFGISDTNHKNKIILKAMDLVLFGPPKVFYNPIKDALLALAILVAISGLFFSAVQRRKAQNQIGKMIEEVDKLQVNEQKFIDIQTELHEAEKKNETVVKEKQSLEKKLKIEINQAKNEAERLSKERELTKTEVERLRLAEEELEQVRLALFNAEAKQCQNSSVNRELQSYLKTTYRKEREQYNFKKAAADKQLEEAKQWGLKMKKKRAGVVSSLKMIHGNALEAVENRICSARTALIEATSDLQELSSRWRRIESLCNFNITASDDAEFGSTISLAGSDSNSSPEPSTYAGSIPRIASSNAVKDLAKMKNRVNGHKDSTDSDDSSHIEKRRKGKNLWRLVRESRLNSDQKWQDLLHQADQI
ncbi:stromal interaction molecule 1-like isoform X4 [Bolinopsis microptera]|uniref:stromal interaction molecule 1-like isoform X4 n=1 Tax=Bolinopsis microptera TaxID=2820187 RepID=UPI003079BCBF